MIKKYKKKQLIGGSFWSRTLSWPRITPDTWINFAIQQGTHVLGREREQKAQAFKLSLRDHKHIWSSCISSIFQPQGFANSGKGERGGGGGKFPTVGRGDWKLHWGDFFMGWWEPEEEWFSRFKPFSKLKSAFYEYWTSIKIKISMTCMFKEYKIKTKMVKKHWRHLKMMFLLGCNLKIVFKWGEGV